ncbi:MAG: 4'-phosphopantetheinyl transferase superfamily protein [Elusimicrobiaceae bacterium]|nr:4'-phosphopantetheinyl transferase superfamily protein [Elusimicrobiaceae bacterium]
MAYHTEIVDLTTLPPAHGILSPREEAYYQTLRFPKRRTEWLGGRVALKRVVARERCISDWTQIEILPHENGKPQLFVQQKPLTLAHSITHSHGFAVAAVGSEGTLLGIDLEKIDHRIDAWKRDFFHPDELTEESDAFLTALWTQKEALVKLLGTGLSLRSKEVCCINGTPRFSGRALELYNQLGCPSLTVTTKQWPTGYMFSVAFSAR